MDQQQLKEILTQHAAWIAGNSGERADLSRADLYRADLSGANLSGANLSRADLYRADLSGANLYRADLSGANLSRADLSGANLSGADLSGAGLTGAHLYRADLYRANLTGAGLTDTCLDPKLTRCAREFAKLRRSRGVILYRTAKSQHVGDTVYTPGHTYVANALSWDSATDCHPGIYGYTTLEEAKDNYPGQKYVRIYVRDGEWVWTAKGCPRCARVRVLSYVK